VSIKNDGHYFCRAGGNRPDGLNEPVTVAQTMERIFTSNLQNEATAKEEISHHVTEQQEWPGH
uniref:hypothetical protein n=1 Tax=Escherichia coli TaxID=562 RepID=UPI001FF3E8B2